MSDQEKQIFVKPVPWYLDARFVIFMLILIGPLALPLAWLSPKFSLSWKITITAIAVVVTVLLGQITAAMFRFMSERLKDLQAVSGI